MSESWRLDGYIRVSAVGEHDDDCLQSPAQQRERIERWAATHAVEIAGWQVDLDQTGGRMRRPGLDLVLERIRRRATGGVVVAWLDRFSRSSVREALETVGEIRSHGGRVVALDVAELDPEDLFGEYLLTAMLAMSRLELRRIAERWDLCRRDAVRRGAHMGPAPYGYRKDEQGRLRVEPDEAAAVVKLFEGRALGLRPRQLALYMDEVAPRSSGRPWVANTLRNMLDHRTYLGTVAHGRHVQEGAHEPIISAELWARARLQPAARATPRGRYMLTGLVRCAGCGHRMGGSRGGRRHGLHFQCTGRHASGHCPAPANIGLRRLDVEVTRQLFIHLLQIERKHFQAVDVARAELARTTEAVERSLGRAPRDAAELGTHQARLLELEQRLRAAETRLAGLEATVGQTPDPDRLERWWPGLPVLERRRLVRVWIDAVLVRAPPVPWQRQSAADRIRVLYRGEAPPELVEKARFTRGWAWEDGKPVRALDRAMSTRSAEPDGDPA
jgi:DNA invertase Pin-like site-specific DNA recombinase